MYVLELTFMLMDRMISKNKSTEIRRFLRKDVIYYKFEQHEKQLSEKEETFRTSCLFLLNNFKLVSLGDI